MQEIIRGAAVQFFGIQFRDVNRQPTVPEKASLRVRYTQCGCEKFEDIELAEDSGTWSGTWDSSAADAGGVYWWLLSVVPEAVAAQGQFRLLANPANKRGDL